MSARDRAPRRPPTRRSSPRARRHRRAAAGAPGRSARAGSCRTGRPDQQQAVPAREGDLEPATRLGLAADVGEVRERGIAASRGHRPCRPSPRPSPRNAPCGARVASRRDRGDRTASTASASVLDARRPRRRDQPRLLDGGRGHDDATDPASLEGGDHRQDAGHRPHLAAERQLPDQRRSRRGPAGPAPSRAGSPSPSPGRATRPPCGGRRARG